MVYTTKICWKIYHVHMYFELVYEIHDCMNKIRPWMWRWSKIDMFKVKLPLYHASISCFGVSFAWIWGWKWVWRISFCAFFGLFGFCPNRLCGHGLRTSGPRTKLGTLKWLTLPHEQSMTTRAVGPAARAARQWRKPCFLVLTFPTFWMYSWPYVDPPKYEMISWNHWKKLWITKRKVYIMNELFIECVWHVLCMRRKRRKIKCTVNNSIIHICS